MREFGINPADEKGGAPVHKTPETLLVGNAIKRMLKSGFETFKILCEQVEPMVKTKDDQGLKTLLSEMNSTILAIQKDVNMQLELMDVPETHIATRIASITLTEKEERAANINHYNMAFITVVGIVEESPKKFVTRSGMEMFSFRVLETERYADKEYRNVFEVVARMDDYLFEHLRKDVGVTVAGSFSSYQKKVDDRTFFTLKITTPQISLH